MGDLPQPENNVLSETLFNPDDKKGLEEKGTAPKQTTNTTSTSNGTAVMVAAAVAKSKGLEVDNTAHMKPIQIITSGESSVPDCAQGSSDCSRGQEPNEANVAAVATVIRVYTCEGEGGYLRERPDGAGL